MGGGNPGRMGIAEANDDAAVVPAQHSSGVVVAMAHPRYEPEPEQPAAAATGTEVHGDIMETLPAVANEVGGEDPDDGGASSEPDAVPPWGRQGSRRFSGSALSASSSSSSRTPWGRGQTQARTARLMAALNGEGRRDSQRPPPQRAAQDLPRNDFGQWNHHQATAAGGGSPRGLATTRLPRLMMTGMAGMAGQSFQEAEAKRAAFLRAGDVAGALRHAEAALLLLCQDVCEGGRGEEGAEVGDEARMGTSAPGRLGRRIAEYAAQLNAHAVRLVRDLAWKARLTVL